MQNCISNLVVERGSHRVYFTNLVLNASGPPQVWRTGPWAAGTPNWTLEAANLSGLPSNKVVNSMVSVSVGTQTDRLRLIIDAVTYLTTDGRNWTSGAAIDASHDMNRILLFDASGVGNHLFQSNVRGWYSPNLGATSWRYFCLGDTGTLGSCALGPEHTDTRSLFSSAPMGYMWAVNDGAFSTGSHYNVVEWLWNAGNTSGPTSGTGIDTSGLAAWQTYMAGVVRLTDGTERRRVYVGAQDNGDICFNDARSATATTLARDGGDEFALQTAPSNPDRAYVRFGGADQAFDRTDNFRTASQCSDIRWTRVTPPETDMHPGGIIWSRSTIGVHPAEPGHVYFLSILKVGASTNGGDCFTMADRPGTGGQPSSILVESCGTNCGRVYVGTERSGIYTATFSCSGACCGAAGAVCPCGTWSGWTAWGLNTTPPRFITSLGSTGGATPIYFAATSDGLYRRVGGVWESSPATGGGGYIVNDVTVDPSCTTRVYAALGFGSAWQSHRGGIRVSSSSGASGSWSSITVGTPVHEAPVVDVEVDPVDPHLLYAATFGRGFWFYDWGAALPACMP